MPKLHIAITGPRDERGHAPFTAYWIDVAGPWRTELIYEDGNPVGYRRAQCFNAMPEEYVARGAILCASEKEAESLGWHHPTRALKCSRCGEKTLGRSWHDANLGFGICVRCVGNELLTHALYPARGSDMASITKAHGIEGYHWNVEGDKVHPPRVFRVDAHEFEITTTDRHGWYSDHRLYHVRCRTCDAAMHDSTASPAEQIRRHLRPVNP